MCLSSLGTLCPPRGLVAPPLVLPEEKYFAILARCCLNQTRVRQVLVLCVLKWHASYSCTFYSLGVKVKLKK